MHACIMASFLACKSSTRNRRPTSDMRRPHILSRKHKLRVPPYHTNTIPWKVQSVTCAWLCMVPRMCACCSHHMVGRPTGARMVKRGKQGVPRLYDSSVRCQLMLSVVYNTTCQRSAARTPLMCVACMHTVKRDAGAARCCMARLCDSSAQCHSPAQDTGLRAYYHTMHAANCVVLATLYTRGGAPCGYTNACRHACVVLCCAGAGLSRNIQACQPAAAPAEPTEPISIRGCEGSCGEGSGVCLACDAAACEPPPTAPKPAAGGGGGVCSAPEAVELPYTLPISRSASTGAPGACAAGSSPSGSACAWRGAQRL